MKLNKRVIGIISVILFLSMVIQMASCGTLLYPGRRHSNIQVDPAGRQVDPAVAVLDAACLVFFVIPGIIAFAVDFATGAIYLPQGKKQSNATGLGLQKRVVIQLLPDKMNKAALEQIISREAGINVSFDDKSMQAFEINRHASLDNLLAKPDRILLSFNK